MSAHRPHTARRVAAGASALLIACSAAVLAAAPSQAMTADNVNTFQLGSDMNFATTATPLTSSAAKLLLKTAVTRVGTDANFKNVTIEAHGDGTASTASEEIIGAQRANVIKTVLADAAKTVSGASGLVIATTADAGTPAGPDVQVFQWRVAPVSTASTTSTIAMPAKKITICHRTHSAKNPYRLITVSTSAVTGAHGHKGHRGGLYAVGAKSWGDIIPGGDADGVKLGGSSGGKLNWTTAGKLILPGPSGSALCGGMTAEEFFTTEVAAGVDPAVVVADLNEQQAVGDSSTGYTIDATATTPTIEPVAPAPASTPSSAPSAAPTPSGTPSGTTTSPYTGDTRPG